jgi:hypothetical protein
MTESTVIVYSKIPFICELYPKLSSTEGSFITNLELLRENTIRSELFAFSHSLL